MVNQRFAIHPPQLVGRIQAPRPGEDLAVAFRRMHGELDGAMQELQRFLKYLQNAIDNDQTTISNVDNSVTNLGDQYNLESAAVPVEHTHSAEEVLGLTEDRAKLNLHEHPHAHARQDVQGAEEDHALLNLHEHPHTHAELDDELAALTDLANLEAGRVHSHAYADLQGAQLLLPDGSAAAPALAIGDVNSGFYAPYVYTQYLSQGGYVNFGFSYAYFKLASTGALAWTPGDATAAQDLILARDAANVLAQRNGANAQTCRIYGTYTNGTNYERLSVALTAGTGASIGPETAGTGADNLDLTLFAAGTGMVIVTSDVKFSGSGVGLPYGSCDGDEIAWSQANMVQDTWYRITDADIVDGHGGLNLITHDGNGKLTVTIAGRYLCHYGVTVEMNGANNHCKVGFLVNGSIVTDGKHHLHFPTANTEQQASGAAILSLAAGDTLEIGIMNPDAGTPTATVDHTCLTMVQVGG